MVVIRVPKIFLFDFDLPKKEFGKNLKHKIEFIM